MRYLLNLLYFIVGCALSALTILFIKGIWDFKVNIIDMLMLIATIVLSIMVLFLTKALNKKDIVRDLVIADLKELSELYEQNSLIFTRLQQGEVSLESAKK